MMLRIHILLLAFVVGAVHSIHDPAYTGIKTKTYRRDPQISQALHYQQHQQHQQQQHQQQQQDHFTFNNKQDTVNFQQRPLRTRINSAASEGLSQTINYNNIHALQQRQFNHQHSNREQPSYERKFHGRHGAIAPASLSSSNWDDAEHVLTDVFSGCPTHFTGQLPYAYDCRRFLNCWNGRGHIQSCAPGTVFNPDALECDRPDKVVCGAIGSVKGLQSHHTHANNRIGLLLDAKVKDVPYICQPGVTGLHPHPTDCTKFLNCANGNVYVQDCGPGTAFSISMMACEYKHKVDCSGREDGSHDDAQQPTYVMNAFDGKLDGIFCPASVSGHFPHPFDYSKFMHCKHGNTAIQNCIPGTMFSISKRFCDSYEEIDARDHVSNTIHDQNFAYSLTVVSCPPGMYGEYLYPYDCTKYISCKPNQQIEIQSCALGMVYNHLRRECLPEQEVQATDRVGYASALKHTTNKSTTSTVNRSNKGNSIIVNCPRSATGVYPYPFDCGKYLRCQNGQISVELCSAGNVFSLSTKRCELKGRVDSSERVVLSKNNDYLTHVLSKNNELTENLDCPPGIDGRYLHPFDYSAYLNCSHGLRSIEYCPLGTIFSITKQQCVAKDQVKNFDRVDYFQEIYNPPLQVEENSEAHWPQRAILESNDYTISSSKGNAICPPVGSSMMPHPFDCHKYLNCVEGRTNIEICESGKAWDIAMELCVSQHQVNCGTRSKRKRLGPLESIDLFSPFYGETVECKPGVTGLFPHPFDCTKFLNCQNGRTIVQNCIAGNVFSVSKKYCELKEQVEISDRVPFVHEYGHELMEDMEAGDFQKKAVLNPNHISCPAGAMGMHLYPFDDHKYVKCDGDRTVIYACSQGTVFQLVSKRCAAEVDHNFEPTFKSITESRPMPAYSYHQSSIQCPYGASGMYPHPYDCAKFLNCANGVTSIQDCASGTAWNRDLQICDFEDKVNCAPQFASPLDGSLTTGRMPSHRVECPKESSGLYPHPYDCTKFLNCANGITHVQNCSPGTAWNRTMKMCAFMPNVDCTLQNYTNIAYLRPTNPEVHPNINIVNFNKQSTQYQPNYWNIPVTDSGSTYQPSRPVVPTPSDSVYEYRKPNRLETTTPTLNQQPQHINSNGHESNGGDMTSPGDRLYGSQPDRWTSMQRPRPNASATDSSQPKNTHWNGTDVASNIPYSNIPSILHDTGFSVHQHTPGQGVAAGSLQPNRNHGTNVRKYSTPLAPFAPIPSTTTPIPTTNFYYAQPVGSQEDSREVFNNISGGDLISHTALSSNYSNPTRSNTLTPNLNQPGYDLQPFPTANWTPSYSNTPQYKMQYDPIFTRYDSKISSDRSHDLHTSVHSPDEADESNLYGGLQPPRSTPNGDATYPTTNLIQPSDSTLPVRKISQANEQETQAHVYQLYPHIQNAREQSFSRDPHYSRAYSGVAHSRNTSWSNEGIKSHHYSVNSPRTYAQLVPDTETDLNAFPKPGNYNRQHNSPSQLDYHNDEFNTNDPMYKHPINDALRMLLRPYFNRSGTVSENDAIMAESHIMNLAAAASIPSINTRTAPTITSTTSTAIRQHSQKAEYVDDVELIFTDEQLSLVAVPKRNSTSTTSPEFHRSLYTNSSHHPQKQVNQNELSELDITTNTHNYDLHQRHPHHPYHFISDERSSSLPTQNINWPHHRHHHSHNKSFHKNNPHLSNPFETTTIKPGEQAESITPHSSFSGVDLRLAWNNVSCEFSCGNGKCIKDFEVCDGVNNCDNRKDEAKCEHLGYEIRLRGGESLNMGRIEVKILEKWGYVCDDKFGLLDADVVCKELGFELGASEVRGNSFYPPVESNFSFIMDEVDCIGNETSLKHCVFKGWGVNNCGPDEVVGVVCKVPQLKCPNNYWLCSTSKECIPPAFVCDNTPDCKDESDESERVCNSPIEYRLEGGRSSNVGRVEVKYRGEWGTVCDDDFGLNEAQVLCNSLGFFGAPKIEKNIFGPGSGPIWLDQVSCFGNETSIDKCNHWTWGEHNCNHTEDLGISCTAGPAPRKTTPSSSIKGSSNIEIESNIEDISSIEDIGLYGNLVQRSSKFLNVNNQKRCGQFNQNLTDEYEHPEERVVNGTMAKRGQHPWQATIRTKGRGGISSHWCGAVLISKRHLLTAAHCLVGYPKGAYFIRMGDHYANIAESSEIDSYIENWYIHEKFRDKTHMNNDIALIVLKHSVRFNDYIQPICLPDQDARLQVHRMCTISGWGSIKSGVSTPSNILRAAQLPILSDETCKQAHVYGTSMTEGMFCAGSLDESVDACDGDSGGPLVCSDQEGKTLYGIISWGQQCGFANKPGVYVRIAKYIDWIYEKINFSMQQASN